MHDKASAAITAALSQNWEAAIALNKEILSTEENDIEALSRTAYAHMKLGNRQEAQTLYEKIILLDQYNIVAKKNLERLKTLPIGMIPQKTGEKNNAVSPRSYIEEPGKTRTVSLMNIAPASVLSCVCIGDTVFLHAKKHSIEVRDGQKTYLGAIPDDVTFRLLSLMNAGNTYGACIKNLQKKSLSIFLYEISRSKTCNPSARL